MPSIVITKSKPTTAGYQLLSPYTDDETTFTENSLCPRYAELDPTSGPPSPASIESFDILDTVPWRQSYILLESGSGQNRVSEIAQRRWRKKRNYIVMALLSISLVTGCGFGGYLAIKHEKTKLKGN